MILLYSPTFFLCLAGIHFANGEQLYPYNHVQKEGSCSPLLTRQICHNSCEEDYNCPGTQKCCDTSCGGKVCSPPVSPRKNTNLAKPGLCPLVPAGEWVCSSRCRSDDDCWGSKKCCKNRCGALGCYIPIPTM